MCMTPKFWEALVDEIGAPALRDERFADMARRREHKAELIALLDAEFARRSTAAWLTALAGKVPVAPVLDLPGALHNPFVAQVGMVQALPHPAAPGFRMLANPIKLDGQRLPGRGCAALGADNAALLPAGGSPGELPG
jgi:crotonobetainyl-CoA:carnitine CoA-transferase CaiB-like acyl-CoA transferase